MKKFSLIIFIILLFQNVAFCVEDVKKVYLEEAIQAALKNNIDYTFFFVFS